MNAECSVGSPQATPRAAKPARPTRIESPRIGSGAPRLTRRETEMLRELIHGAGDSSASIAYALGVTEGTIKVYFSRLCRKIGLGRPASRVAMALWAERRWNDQS